MLIRNNQNGSAAYDKIANIMNIKPRNIYWKSDDQIAKLKVIQGFKALYKDDGIIIQNTKETISIMLQTIETIIKTKDLTQIQPIHIPKSKAKEYK